MMENMAGKIAKYVAIALIALAPIFSFGQKQDTTAWVPFNCAGNLQNDPIQNVFRPSEVGVAGTFSEKQTGASVQANYNKTLTLFRQVFVVGMGTVASRTQSAAGASNAAGVRAGVGWKIRNSDVQAGVKMQLAGKGNTLALTPVSFLARYTNKRIRVGTEIVPKTKSISVSADVFVKRNWAVSGTVSDTIGKRPVFSLGAERRVRGWQFGASVHPEQNFFRGKPTLTKLDPRFTIRKTTKKSTFNITVFPMQKKIAIGAGWRF
jgi:hypothetical protein